MRKLNNYIVILPLFLRNDNFLISIFVSIEFKISYVLFFSQYHIRNTYSHKFQMYKHSAELFSGNSILRGEKEILITIKFIHIMNFLVVFFYNLINEHLTGILFPLVTLLTYDCRTSAIKFIGQT
ncbi:hypothetical protein GLOIN_2v1704721 [Rhizophagus irregularis DAOM 181602=DAOM 197198]|uniref:Uncharacterized protein n=1 Tax=Rhizophagus irregularis (strain DAOM 181602 / DAOM 197198 / MUCL 43194) TaxID=747089 RepID=A0A2P4P7G0_RHIID|nr:hypothetical protein GLOIN_2v1704721 [Rhizophagus irregularis DAOM 181602=DAOM 197198]POG61323.1 hypothetical protein GLOIN_2v1704721 [Rhizophagus irregularis DAOM 181602=DAOM 197198]GET49864.1 hypothetical protein GLOIN_2v1704721 [Rhizophagus irregularis DAOM 181602=DAOM 197198]|eukprot:XP_025168189.1 hypothetical protein GLOIN_2v1704721 [Rhizophagus irregularis DAOM 181602=DAOM 197198]